MSARPAPRGFPQFLRFVLIGLMNTAFSYGIYSLLVYLGLNYALANLCALLLGLIVSFTTQASLVFGNPTRASAVRFVLMWGCIYLLNIVLIRQFIVWGLNAYQAGAAALPLVTMISFFAQKYLVFGKRDSVVKR